MKHQGLGRTSLSRVATAAAVAMIALQICDGIAGAAEPTTQPTAPPTTQPTTRPAVEQPADPGKVAEVAEVAGRMSPSEIAHAFAAGRVSPELLAQMQAAEQLASDGQAANNSPLLAAISERPFIRTPESIVQAIRSGDGEMHANVSEPTTSPVNEELDPATVAAAFEADVLAGRWDRVRTFLAEQEQSDAETIFQVVLGKLGHGAGPTGVPREVAMQMHRQQQANAPQAITPLPQDVLALAGSYPYEPTTAHVAALGQMLAAAMAQYQTPQVVLDSLADGRGKFGGEEEAGRLRAADLLLAAGMEVESAHFLPQLADNTTADLLNRHAGVLVAQGNAALQESSGINDQEIADLRQLYQMYGLPVPPGLGQPEGRVPLRPEHAQALALYDRVLQDPEADTAARTKAIGQAIGLLDKVDRADAEAFLVRHASADQLADDSLLAALAGDVLKPAGQVSLDRREMVLRMQTRVARTMVSTVDGGADPLDHRAAALLQLFAQAWLAEVHAAETTPSTKQQQRDQGRANDSIRLQTPGGGYTYASRRNLSRYRNQPEVMADRVLLETAPADAAEGDLRWLDACGDSLRPALLRAMCVVLIRDEQFDAALAYLEPLAEIEPESASELARMLLSTWASAANPNPSVQDPNAPRYVGMPAASQQTGGISLTRARQERNLARLQELLEAFGELQCEPPPAQAVVSAFIGAHSDAEVFRLEDITRIFGPLDELDAASLRTFLAGMRERLAQQWRSPQVQTQAGTQRDDAAIAAEIERGYDILLNLVADHESSDWHIAVTGAVARFDRNEFRYGRGIDLADYTAGRDEAFDCFRAAADLYTSALREGEVARQEESAEPFMSWFLAALGTSDLAQLTRQQAPRMAEVDAVREKIAALPQEVSLRHFDLFAGELIAQAATIPPQLKDRYLRGGLKVVGADHPAARSAAELVEYYDDLLHEVELVAHLDGDTTQVGVAPFGVHIGVRHTESLGRESGGFGRYLAQPSIRGYQPPGMPRSDRDVFEQSLREALTDSFEIVSISWHAADVAPRGDLAGRLGWRYTPLAFVLLQARDPAADRVPPVRLDLNFRDTLGQVVLPVESSVVAIDARTMPAAFTQSLDDVTLIETLDESKLDEGSLTLDIRASATGLVPALEQLVELQPAAGWTVTEVEDGGLIVTGLDLESPRIRPSSERTWLVRFERNPDAAPSPVGFEFLAPGPALEGIGAETTYQRYAGNDVVEAAQRIRLAEASVVSSLSSMRFPIAAAVVAMAVAAFIAASSLIRRRSALRGTAGPSIPKELTPFTLLTALRRLEATGSVNGDSSALASDIRRLEEAHFAGGTTSAALVTPTTDELQPIAQRWLAKGS